jgi:hypothetical protein
MSVRQGLVTLEGNRGKGALEQLGHTILREWRQVRGPESGFVCTADPNRMTQYVVLVQVPRVLPGEAPVVGDHAAEPLGGF